VPQGKKCKRRGGGALIEDFIVKSLRVEVPKIQG